MPVAAMKIAGKILLYLAALIFAGGFITLFWEEIPGELVKYNRLSTTYVGNSGMAVMGATNRGGATALTAIKYRYSVNGIHYTALSIQFSGGAAMQKDNPGYFRPTTTKVYYSSTFPFLSVIDHGIQIIWVLLLSVLGLGLIETHKWFIKYSTPEEA
jgi:hypothetical protein